MTNQLIEYLSKFATESRVEQFRTVLAQRTRHIKVVLEDIFQPHNASAVLRTCDCFGIQDVHIIENQYEYRVNPDVALGSAQWLSLFRHKPKPDNTLSVISDLKAQGYKIVATTPHTNDVSLEDFDLERGKFALMFGSERPGLSPVALANADEFLKIPMFGFTESLNISVSAAIILNRLREKLQNSDIQWQLSELEQNVLMLSWLRQSIKKSHLIEKRFFEDFNNNVL